MKPKYLSECLASIKEQQEQNFQCYIVDGSPEDWESYEYQMKIIAEYTDGDSRFEYHRHPNLDKPYVSEAQNYGFSLGSNPYVQFLGGDDFFYTHHLKEMKKAIEEEYDDNTGFWFCMVKCNHKNILDLGEIKMGRVRTWLLNHYLMYPYLESSLLKYFHFGNPLYMNGVVLDRKGVENVGGFDEELVIGEDVDLILRIVKSGCKGRWLPYVGSYLRIHEGQTTDEEKRGETPYDKEKMFAKSLKKNDITHSDCKVGRTKLGKKIEGKMLEKHKEKIMVTLDKKHLLTSEYEILEGMASGGYSPKTKTELENGEMLFLLKNKKEEILFMERDIVV